MPETYFQQQDIDGMLRDFGRPMTFDPSSFSTAPEDALWVEFDDMLVPTAASGELPPTSCLVLVDRIDLEALPGAFTHVTAGAITATMKTGAIPGLSIGSLGTLDGDPYRIIAPMKDGDGALTRLLLARA